MAARRGPWLFGLSRCASPFCTYGFRWEFSQPRARFGRETGRKDMGGGGGGRLPFLQQKPGERPRSPFIFFVQFMTVGAIHELGVSAHEDAR